MKRWQMAAALILLVSVAAAIDVFVAVQIYGDWTCAFSECRRIVE